jgi:hypothetical protein
MAHYANTLPLTPAPCEFDDCVFPSLDIVRQEIKAISHRTKTRLCSRNPSLSRKLPQRPGLLSPRARHFVSGIHHMNANQIHDRRFRFKALTA